MKQLQQSRMQAAIELLDHMIRREITDREDKYKRLANLDMAMVNEVLVVAGADPVKLDEEKEIEVIE